MTASPVRSWSRRLIWLLLLPVLGVTAVCALVVALWFWADTDTSLATVLSRAGQFLPAGQSLSAEGVSGSLRRGGRINLLRWHNEAWTLEAQQIDFAWQPAALLDKRLQLDSLHVNQLTLESTAASSAHTPWQSLKLPLQVDAHFAVDKLHWVGPPVLDVQTLAGHYTFDDQQHSLKLAQAQVAAGTYQGQATLQATAPLLLNAQVQGRLSTPVPGSQQTQVLDASASVQGDLAGAEGLLDVQAQLQPATAASKAQATQTSQTMQAQLTAQIKPWVNQPVVKANASFRQLDLAALWPQAPQTLLTGDVAVVPVAATWQARAAITNALSGPIDKTRLPVQAAQAQIVFDHGQWQIQSLNAQLGQGQLQAQGVFNTATTRNAPSGWQGSAQLQGVNPSAIYSTLADSRMDGKLNAQSTKPVAQIQGIDFTAQLQPTDHQPQSSSLQKLRLKTAQADGHWDGKTLRFQTLHIQTDDALLKGNQLSVQPATRAVQGQLQLTLPGADLNLQGQQSEREGAGDVALNLSNTQQALAWLAKLPGLEGKIGLPAGADIQAQGQLAGRWSGGWGNAGRDVVVQAKLQVPQLDWRNIASTNTLQTTPQSASPSSAPLLRISNLNAELSGRMSALTLAWQAQADWRNHRFQAQTNNPLVLHWTPNSGGGQLNIDAAQISVTDTSATANVGSTSNTVVLTWQPLLWQKTGNKTEFKSQGKLTGLPMSWLELASNVSLSELGLSGNLVFDGQWDAQATESLKLQASLIRRQGDLQVRADTAAGINSGINAGVSGINAGVNPGINAGVKEASLSISTAGDALRAALRWDSERAGHAQVDFSTQLQVQADGWRWPVDAPLAGTVQAHLPQVGVWSVLAPPGWRMRGTLDAGMTLSGTRSAPQWRGTLQANDLALRSVVEGIEFSNGRLRATLQGQRLDIQEFSLQGAGTGGGQLSAKGFATWLANTTDAAEPNPSKRTGLAQIQIELETVATNLRVSARADRRLAVSGMLQTKLQDARLSLRGDLKADQALFILPDESAPSLGSDVFIKPSASSTATTPTAATPTAATPTATTPAATTQKPASTTTSSPNASSSALRVRPDLAVTLDLGPDFRVEGRGLTTRLSGLLALHNSPETDAAPRLIGEVRTVLGTYKAYGQRLSIEEGVLRFTGKYDNPALDILALRPNLSQRVGVKITGTALAPRIRLFSDPEMPEGEKLAWLVLGRSGANGGQEAALLQQAALALLSGEGPGISDNLASALGLDELSISGAAAGNASSATITLGKRISRDFYVVYERSLAGTLGTFSIFYDLSKRFTLRAKTGEQSTIDLIFTVPYD